MPLMRLLVFSSFCFTSLFLFSALVRPFVCYYELVYGPLTFSSSPEIDAGATVLFVLLKFFLDLVSLVCPFFSLHVAGFSILHHSGMRLVQSNLLETRSLFPPCLFLMLFLRPWPSVLLARAVNGR
jgi:hypothetical protein